MTYPRFPEDIAKMNATYELPTVGGDWNPVVERLEKFADILGEEILELEDVQDLANTASETNWNELQLMVKVELADFLADIVVYAASEALRWEIPLDQVLKVVMASNFSKLGRDGKAIKDHRGKFMKGPDYWRPETAIQAVLSGRVKPDEIDSWLAGGNVPIEEGV